MKLLIIEQNKDLRADIKKRVEESARSTGLKGITIEAIDMKQVGGSTPDLIILGEFAKDKILEIHSRLNSIHPNVHIILLLGTNDYLEDAVELHKRTQIRIVAQGDLPQLSQIIIDLSQPTSLRSEFIGKARIISVLGIKGGSGISSLCASLASCYAEYNVSTLLLDMNYCNRDLTTFSQYSIEGQHALSQLLQIPKPDFKNIKPCIEKFRADESSMISIIGAAESFIRGYELFSNTLSVNETNSIWFESKMSLLANEFDTIVIDLGNHWGPSTLSALSISSHVCFMMEDHEWSMKRSFDMLHKISSESEDPAEFDFRKWKIVLNGIKSISAAQESIHQNNSNYNLIKNPTVYGIPWSKKSMDWFIGPHTPYEIGDSGYKDSIEVLAKSIRPI